MKENVLDVLMYLFENYFYDEPEEEPIALPWKKTCTKPGSAMAKSTRLSNGSTAWLSSAFSLNSKCRRISRSVFSWIPNHRSLDTTCRDFLMYLSNVGILDAQRRELVLDRLLALEAMKSRSKMSSGWC